jgi:hypothetical protein
MLIQESFESLELYIKRENYAGYDPYDTLTSWIPFKLFGKWPSAIATQIQKRNPLNIRPILGIRKGINPKAFGLFLQSYSLLYKKTNNDEYLKKADYFFEWLSKNYSKGYSGKCWGYNFPWSNPQKYMDAFVPSSVVTGFVVKGLYEYYGISKNDKVLELIEGACAFLDNDLEKVQNDYGVSISYTPVQKDICYNASLLAGESFAKAYSISGNDKYKKLAIDAVSFVIKQQQVSGVWNYAIDLEFKSEEKQIDFHQGYILESIYEIKKVLSVEDSNWDNSLRKGMEFYISQQFCESGRSYWRLPKKYPVEIHNQSQGIITLVKLKDYHPEALKFASTIANWTIENMQSKEGFFYYQIFKTHKNKISYMRWNNAWMFLALSILKKES